MKNLLKILSLCITLAVFLSACSASGGGTNQTTTGGTTVVIPTNIEQVNVNPAKTDAPVINPGMGWVLYGDPSNQTDETLALSSTGYARFSWSDLNPAEGVYDFSQIDNAIADWSACGKQFAFGVMSVNTSGPYNQIPQWVYDKGMQYTMGCGETGGDLDFYIPVWNDPVYVAACTEFAQALAAKYDGDPNVAYIDIRNFGNWGEDHLYPFSATTKDITDAEVEQLWQPYIDNFKHTQLAVCCNGKSDPHINAYNWAVDQGVTLRRDGLMGVIGYGGSDGNELSPAFGKLPVIWEFFSSFRDIQSATDRKWNPGDLIRDIIVNQPSYIGMGQWGDDAAYMLSQEPDMVKKAANLMGYHFVVSEASYMNVIDSGQPSAVTASVENTGVTKMYTDCTIKLALLDANGAPVSVFSTDWQARSFAAGATTNLTANMQFDAARGNYRLAIGFFGGAAQPAYNIGNSDRTPDGWYVLGDIAVE